MRDEWYYKVGFNPKLNPPTYPRRSRIKHQYQTVVKLHGVFGFLRFFVDGDRVDIQPGNFVAARKPVGGQHDAFNETIFCDGLFAELRAGGEVKAACRKLLGDAVLVYIEQSAQRKTNRVVFYNSACFLFKNIIPFMKMRFFLGVIENKLHIGPGIHLLRFAL